MPVWLLLANLLPGDAEAQSSFQVTITNTSPVSWHQGVLAVLPGAGSPSSLLPIGQTPTTGDPYDTYAYIHDACDLGGEDDSDATLLISRWPSLTLNVNAFLVGPLAPATAAVVNFTAAPGDVLSFVAAVDPSLDDAVVMTSATDLTDTTVDLFDGLGAPLPALSFTVVGVDINEIGPGGGGSCAAVCPPSVPCYVAPGGGAGPSVPQPVTGGCVPVSWWTDGDGDGFGSGPGSSACDPPVGSASVGGDCNDADPLVSDTVWWYRDDDVDGHGDPSTGLNQCIAPYGYVADASDCNDADPDNWVSCSLCGDNDGDGYAVGCDAYNLIMGPDCDDADPANQVGQWWWVDGDQDGHGEPGLGVFACNPGFPAALVGDDCNDANPAAFPGAVEVCDGADNDCDLSVDDADPDVVPATPWYVDDDLDGYGDPVGALFVCAAPPGRVVDGTDCDDADPDNWQSCGSCVDADLDFDFAGCDTYVTRNGPDCDDTNPFLNGGAVWYEDADGDGIGGDQTQVACLPPPGFVAADGDCDDTDPTAFPAADEVCDGDDEDCDGLVDDADADTDPASMSDWHADDDLDGYGDPAVATLACGAPPGLLADDTDCDDTDPDNWVSCLVCADADGDGDFAGCDAWTTRPGPDCDDTDAALNSGAVWFFDGDGDGAGDPLATTVACVPPPGFVDSGTDCDDGDPNAFPGGTEVCDGDDEDCDALVDDADPDVDLNTSRPWYADADWDGYGDASDGLFGCGPPPGRVADDTDCDDADPDNWVSCLTCEDADGDGAFVGCDAYDTRPGPDCADADATRHPDASEVCAGGDEDCDGQVGDADPDVTDAFLWFVDVDNDGWGNPYAGEISCTPLPDTSLAPGDCDDTNPLVYPYALEFCDGVDEDCDGALDDNAVDAVPWWLDGDDDGYGDPLVEVLACEAPPDHVDDPTDCDDAESSVWPGAPELCDGLDNDCDDAVDDGVVDVTWYPDVDGDGWGDPEGAVEDCAAPPDTTDRPGDCDDADADVNPDGTEVAGNGVDEDCDGQDLAVDGPSSRDWTEVEEAPPVDPGCSCATGGAGSVVGWLVVPWVVAWRRGRPLRTGE